MKKNIIHYGFGKTYLPDWGLKEALREIYQNFLDYGDFDEIVVDNGNKVRVAVSNDWMPESLDFLRIGNSKKHNTQAIGKHGEGLKMAFLILLREGMGSEITTPIHNVEPSLYTDAEIGECFCLVYRTNKEILEGFRIEFDCPKQLFLDFKENLITPKDVIFDDHYWGQIVEKPNGNIYSGGLFVTHSKNISKAYNIAPKFLPLDRDRSVPRSFDLNYAASKINEAQGKFDVDDLSMSDTSFVQKVPTHIKERIEPVLVGNSIEFKHTDVSGNDKVIANESVKQALTNDSFFTSAIKSLRMFLAKQLGLYDMLIEFRNKHVHGTDALMDFDLILERVEKKEKEVA